MPMPVHDPTDGRLAGEDVSTMRGGATTRRAFLLASGALIVASCADEGSESAAAASDIDRATASPTEAVATQDATPDAIDPTAVPTESTAEAAAADTAATEIPATEVPAADGPVQIEPAMFAALGVCQLLPTSTAGPFPSRELLDRRDIHEGYPGHPLRLGIRVVDASCQPIPNATVDIWHTDATGDYSSYDDSGTGKDEGEGSTFCRGVQTSDANGIVEFETIYPGWYEGRAVHIHVTVYVEGESVRTGQLYLDENVSERIFATGVYAKFGPPDTPWSRDRIVGDPTSDGTGITLTDTNTTRGPGTLGLINLGVDPANPVDADGRRA